MGMALRNSHKALRTAHSNDREQTSDTLLRNVMDLIGQWEHFEHKMRSANELDAADAILKCLGDLEDALGIRNL